MESNFPAFSDQSSKSSLNILKFPLETQTNTYQKAVTII